MPPGVRPWAPLAVAAILSAAAAWAIYVHFATAVVPFDDAYISYRYAENLAAGRGLVYNAGERVFGSSTPLYVLWLTALRLLLPGDLAAAAVRANAIGFVAAALLAGWLVRRLTDRPLVGAATALALLVNPMLLTLSTGGMESYWFLSLALAAMLVLAGDRPRPGLFGVLAGLAILTRAEGVLLGPIALAGLRAAPSRPAQGGRGRRDPARRLGALLHPLLRLADPAVGGGEGNADLSAAAAGSRFEQIVGNLDHWVSADHFGVVPRLRRAAIGTILAGAAAAAALLPAARRRRAWMPIVMLVGLAAIYSVANTLYFEWYWPPVSVMLVLALIVGLVAVVTAAQSRLLALDRARLARVPGRHRRGDPRGLDGGDVAGAAALRRRVRGHTDVVRRDQPGAAPRARLSRRG